MSHRPPHRPPLLRSLLLFAFVLTQLLAPLLHAHLGVARETGLHVHGPQTAQAALAATPGHPQLQAPAEPAEVDVEPGLQRKAPAASLPSALLAGTWGLGLLLAAWVSACAAPVAFAAAPGRLRWRSSDSHPPPAHAPPLPA